MGLIKNLNELGNLFALLQKNINLIIGIYPWPGQILYDNLDIIIQRFGKILRK